MPEDITNALYGMTSRAVHTRQIFLVARAIQAAASFATETCLKILVGDRLELPR